MFLNFISCFLYQPWAKGAELGVTATKRRNPGFPVCISVFHLPFRISWSKYDESVATTKHCSAMANSKMETPDYVCEYRSHVKCKTQLFLVVYDSVVTDVTSSRYLIVKSNHGTFVMTFDDSSNVAVPVKQ